MKLQNIHEVEDFRKVIHQCKDDVFLKSQEGDVFNLKSAMSEYIALGRLLSEQGDSLELFASNVFWGEMTEADQQAFATAAKEAAEYSWTLYMEGLANDIHFMQDSGLTVTDPSEEEHEKMKQAVEPVYDYLRSQYDWVDDVLELVNSVE